MNAPCFRCTEGDRFIGCHSMCRDYIAFQVFNAKKNANKQQYYNKNGILIESHARHKKRNTNKNRVLKTTMGR